MIEIGLGHYLVLGAVIFSLGMIGIFLNRKNVIVILMSIELILLAVNINLVSFSIFLQDIVGQIFTMLILTVAAAEAAIGLAIIVVYYRNKGSIKVEEIVSRSHMIIFKGKFSKGISKRNSISNLLNLLDQKNLLEKKNIKLLLKKIFLKNLVWEVAQ